MFFCSNQQDTTCTTPLSRGPARACLSGSSEFQLLGVAVSLVILSLYCHLSKFSEKGYCLWQLFFMCGQHLPWQGLSLAKTITGTWQVDKMLGGGGGRR